MRWYTFQVKSVRVRADRRNDYVIYAKKGNGEPYTQSDADYVIGVLEAEDGGAPRVWMFENRGLGEYWATEQRADTRWHKLPIALDRESYETEAAVCPA